MGDELQTRCCNPFVREGHKSSVLHVRCQLCGYLVRGAKIAGKYEIVKWIGGGGFGEVYEVREVTLLNRTLVLKILRADMTGQSGGIATEAERLVQLRHPNVLPVYDVGRLDDDNRAYIVLARATGTLAEKFRDPDNRPRLAYAEDLIPYIQQAAKALHHIHDEGFIHQDVKPKNLLLGDDGQVLVADLGAALYLGPDSHKEIESFMGTIHYMPLEQLAGEPRRETDQYALAVSIYELLTGHLPFEYTNRIELIQAIKTKTPPSVRTWNPNIPVEVEPVLSRALSKNYRQRYSSILDFSAAYTDAVERAQKRYYCQICSHQNHTGAQRCASCDAIYDNRYCPYCDTAIRFGQRCCPHCGRLTISSRLVMNSSLVGTTAQRGRYIIKQVLKDADRMVIAIANDAQENGKLVILKRKQFNLHIPSYEQQLINYIKKTERLAQVQHPFLPRVLDRFFEGACYYMVLTYIDGESIEEYLQKLLRPLPEATVVQCMYNLLNLLIALEQQCPPLRHYDISPSNIILEGTKRRAILTGFPIGSPTRKLSPYVPVEPYDHRTCIYTLAATMHHALTNIAPPHHAGYPPLRMLNPSISPALEDIIKRALADPQSRYQTYEDMRKAVQVLLLSNQLSTIRSG